MITITVGCGGGERGCAQGLLDAMKAAAALTAGEVNVDSVRSKHAPNLLDIERVLAAVEGSEMRKNPGRGHETGVFFGTADALISETMLPPMIAVGSVPPVFFGTVDSLLTPAMPGLN